MSDLKTGLERIAEAGVVGIRLAPLAAPRSRRSVRARGIVAALAGACVVLAAFGVAVLVRSPESHAPSTAGGSDLVASASYNVPSEGMSPTLQVGDVVSVAAEFGTIERGDVVRVRFPQTPGGATPVADAGFKRVVGLPGETVAGHDGHVFVNGRELGEPYIDLATNDFAPVAVPRDSYFLLGDNRPNSADSRVWGPVARSAILGIVLRITEPADRAGAIAGSPR